MLKYRRRIRPQQGRGEPSHGAQRGLMKNARHWRLRPGSDTGKLEAAGYRVSVTRRINEKWDQHKLAAAREKLTDNVFSTLSRQKYEPDRRSLNVFMHGNSDGSLKALLIDACTTSTGKPAVKLEAVAQ